MPNLTHKLQYVISSSSQIQSITGTDYEAPAAEFPASVPISFAAGSSNVAIAGLTGLIVANLQSVFLLANQDCTLATNSASGAADVQTISITGTPTGGSFPIQSGGQVTELAYNASASAVQTALQALSSIGSGNVTCTGGPLPGTPVVCTGAGSRATRLQPLMTTFSGSLTGGSSPTVSVAHTTPGTPSDTIALVAGIPWVWGVSAGYTPCPFTTNVTSAYLTCTPATQLRYLIGTL